MYLRADISRISSRTTVKLFKKAKGKVQSAHNRIYKDFAARGIDLNKKKNSGGGKEDSSEEEDNGSISEEEDKNLQLGGTKQFSNSSYAHTEQAYISRVFNQKKALFNEAYGFPKAVIIVFVSYLPPCKICKPTLYRLITDKNFKRKMLKGYYEYFRQAGVLTDKILDGIRMHVVYISSNYLVQEPSLIYGPSSFIHSRR